MFSLPPRPKGRIIIVCKLNRREKQIRLLISESIYFLSPIPKGRIIIVCKLDRRENRIRLLISESIYFLSPIPNGSIIIVFSVAKKKANEINQSSRSPRISLTQVVLRAVRYFASTPGRLIRTPIGNLICNSHWREAMNRNY
jgi:hypothetical protein